MPVAAVAAVTESGEDNMLDWIALEEKCKNCSGCQLHRTRNNVVFGVGDPHADVMFIGEGPGQQEDLQGIPFVGPAGKLLDDIMCIIDLDRNNSYIANIVKCRPPQNRDPQEEEQLACVGYLQNQIQLVKPKIIVCLGRIAATRLIRSDFRITKEHGTWTQKNGIWMTATYHPSALLRDVSKRPETFKDMLSIREKIRQLNAGI
jgi:DNA polymerase